VNLTLLAAAIAAAFAIGGATGIQWQLGVQARADLAAAEVRKSDERRQYLAQDKAAGAHVAALATLNNQLGHAREKIALLSGRECFGADTARLLNTIGTEPSPTPAAEPAGAPPAPAAGADIRFTTERDAAGYIALCRARYAEVASQVNQILDIEEARHPPARHPP
jgi:hypothetical protein